MVAGTEERVGLHVAEHVVHPAHVPLEVEAQASLTGGMGHQRPRGALLRDEQRAGFTSVSYTHLDVYKRQVDDFVALPHPNTARPAPHATGGALDLTLCYRGRPLPCL